MIKLSDILKEIKTIKKATIKKAIQETTSKSMQLFVIEDVLSSGAFNKKESIALREFFIYRKSTPMLNENTVRMITKEMLKEGWTEMWPMETNVTRINGKEMVAASGASSAARRWAWFSRTP